jgi:hypothetical protein
MHGGSNQKMRKKIFETLTNNCTGLEIQKPSRPHDVAQLGDHIVDPLLSLSVRNHPPGQVHLVLGTQQGQVRIQSCKLIADSQWFPS